MKKRFTKPVIIHIVITHLLIIGAFIKGYFPGKECIGIMCSESVFFGFVSAILIMPIVLIVGSILVGISKSQDSKKAVGTYLLSTLGVYIIIISFPISKSLNDAIRESAQHNKINRENAQLIKRTIADEIHKVYPNAKITMLYYQNITDVDLKGYEYTNQPDFDLEIAKWKELKSSKALSNYPYKINVNYFFDDLDNSFATIRTIDLYLFYSPLGMNEEGMKLVNNQIKEFLDSNNISYSILDVGHSFSVTINKKPSLEERIVQEELWKKFINEYNINTELVDIHVHYEDPGDEYWNNLYYNIRNNEWN